jgi:hypothetical protein
MNNSASRMTVRVMANGARTVSPARRVRLQRRTEIVPVALTIDYTGDAGGRAVASSVWGAGVTNAALNGYLASALIDAGWVDEITHTLTYADGSAVRTVLDMGAEYRV